MWYLIVGIVLGSLSMGIGGVIGLVLGFAGGAAAQKKTDEELSWS